MTPVSVILKAARGERSLSIEQVAKAAKLSPTTVSAAEKGTRRPHADTLAALAKFYELKLTALMAADSTAVQLTTNDLLSAVSGENADLNLLSQPTPVV